MDPIQKAGISSITPKPVTDTGVSKPPGGAKFSEVKEASKTATEQPTTQMPKMVDQVSADQRAQLERDLRKKLESTNAKTPKDLFRPEMRTAEADLARLNQKVEAMPKSESTSLLRDRLSMIEDKFGASQKILGGLDKLDSPRDLLKVQVEMYQMTQNIEILSKVVESMSGGMKQLLQTQV
jgi:hypothetical protein